MPRQRNMTEEDLKQLGFMVVGDEVVRASEARPDQSWDLVRLASFAKGELRRSSDAEKEAVLQAHKSAVHLFWAGCALALAREKCKAEGHGAWRKFKEANCLADTTANDAIRLYENAKAPEALEGLGITEAKKKYVYPAKDHEESEPSDDEPESPPGPRRAATRRRKEGGGGREDDESLAAKLADVAQRLSEIVLNEWGRVDWAAEDVDGVCSAAQALSEGVAEVFGKINDELEKVSDERVA